MFAKKTELCWVWDCCCNKEEAVGSVGGGEVEEGSAGPHGGHAAGQEHQKEWVLSTGLNPAPSTRDPLSPTMFNITTEIPIF